MDDNNKIISLVMVVTVGIIMTAAVLMPVITSFNEENTTYYNNLLGYDLDLDGSSKMDVVLTPTETRVNGVVQSDVQYVILTNYAQITSKAGIVKIRGYDPVEKQQIIEDNLSELTISIADNNLKMSFDKSGPVEYSHKYAWLANTDVNGKYGASFFNVPSSELHINDVSQIYTCGTTGSYWYSSIGDKMQIIKYADGSDVKNTVTIDAKPVNGVENVSSLVVSNDSTTSDFDVAYDDQGSTGTVSPLLYIMPREVSGVNTDMSAALGITNVIPVIVIAALLVSIVGAMVLKRE